MRPPWTALLVGVLLAAGSGCSRLSWQEYTSAEGGYRVLLPGTPLVQTIKQGTGSGSFEQHAVVVSLREGDFHAAHADLPTGLVLDFTSVIQGQATLLDARVVEDREMTLAGHKGRAYELEIKPRRQVLSGRIVLVGNRLYHLMVAAQTLGGSSAEVKTFFESFRLTQ
jgi:hypothetical protein